MDIALWRRTARPLAANDSHLIERLQTVADPLFGALARLRQRPSTRALRVTKPTADEIDFRNELIARFGKTD
jgi:hypothetical protein